MKQEIQALLAGTAVALASVAGVPASAAPENVTIVHFNDLDRMGEDKGRGGVARLASVINAEREAGGNVLVTFGGDTISPSLMSGLDEGAHMIDLLNGLGLTAMAIGNHEFDFGPDVAMQRIAEANFPMLGANHRCADGEIIDGAEASIMVDAGEFSIGILGLTTVGTAVKSSPGECTFQDAAATAAEVAGGLREAGADLVIALAHTDSEEDANLLADRSVDILLSGDDHMLRTEYTGKMLFAESGEQADWVTIIDLTLDEVAKDDSTRFVWSAEYRVLDTAGVEPDPTTAAAVKAYEEQLSVELDVELGSTTTELDSRRETVRTQEAAIANMFADAIREATGAQIAAVNGGGIRANRIYEPGTVLTRRDIQSELPFGNKTVVLEVSGQDIIDVVENGLSQIEKGAGRFLHFSGISVAYDPGAEPGSRVVEVTRDGGPIDPAAMFTFAINDYVAGGGDGFAMLSDKARIVDEYAAVLMTVQVFNYLSAHGDVSPMVEGRLKIVN